MDKLLFDGTGESSAIVIDNPPTDWTKYSYSRSAIANTLNFATYKGIRFQAGTPGTEVFLDDMIVRTLGSPKIGILDGNDFASTNRVPAEIQIWGGAPSIETASSDPLNGTEYERITGSAQHDQIAVFNAGFANINIKEKTHLEFYIRGETGGEDIRITIDNCNDISFTNLSSSWQRIRISLYDLTNGTGASTFQNVSFYWTTGPGTIHIEEMSFPENALISYQAAAVTPASIINNETNTIQITATITSAGPGISTTSIGHVALDATSIGGPLIPLTNIGGNDWRATITLPPGVPAGVYRFPLIATNNMGNLYKLPAFDWTVLSPLTVDNISVSRILGAADRLLVTWEDLNNETSYTLYRNMVDNFSTAVSFGLPADQTSYLDTGLTAGTRYYYWLRATDAGGDSSLSAVATNRTNPLDSIPPVTLTDKPEGAYAGEITVVLTSTDTNAGVYQIYYTLDGSNPLSSTTVLSGASPLSLSLQKSTDLKFYAKDWMANSETVQIFRFEIITLPESAAAVFPNLVDLSKGETARIVFRDATRARIRIYNVRGEPVESFPETDYPPGGYAEWNGMVHSSAAKAGAGIYLVSITGDVKMTLKLILKK